MYFHQQVRRLLFFPLARLTFRPVLFNLTAESFPQKLRSRRKSWSFCLFSSPRPINTLLSWAPLPEMHYSQQHRVIYEAAHKTCRIPTLCAPTRCCLSEEDAAVSGKRRGKECVGRPAIPAHLIETNTVTSVLYDEQINLVSTFFKFAAAAAH